MEKFNGRSGLYARYLFWEYMENNFVSTDVLRLQTQEAEKQMEKLSYKEIDNVFDSFFRMCAEYQRLAFMAGAQAGTRLTLELMNEKSAC